MGKIRKGAKCSVLECEDVAIRSVSTEQMDSAGIGVKGKKRAYLCEGHYKEFKKRRKKDRQVERWRWRTI